MTARRPSETPAALLVERDQLRAVLREIARLRSTTTDTACGWGCWSATTPVRDRAHLSDCPRAIAQQVFAGADLSIYATAITATEKERDQLRDQQAAAHAALDRLERELAAERAKLAALESKKSAVEAHKRALHDEVVKLRKRIGSAEAERDAARSRADRLPPAPGPQWACTSCGTLQDGVSPWKLGDEPPRCERCRSGPPEAELVEQVADELCEYADGDLEPGTEPALAKRLRELADRMEAPF